MTLPKATDIALGESRSRERAALLRLDPNNGSETWVERATEFAERLRNQPAPRWLVPELIKEDAITLLHGQPRSMKTFAALEIAVAVAAGARAFHLGRFQCDPAPVLYVTEEDSEYDILNRIEGIARAHRLESLPEGLHLLVRKGVSLDDVESRTRLLKFVERAGIRLIIFDPTRALTACVDGGPRDLKPFSDFLRNLRRSTGAAIILSHHDTKPSPRGDDTRDHAQKASGGGIFSVSDAPIHAVRQGDGKTLLVPSNFKFAQADPVPVLVTVSTVATTTASELEISVRGETKLEQDATDERIQGAILEALKQRPCATQDALFRAVSANRESFRASLRRLALRKALVITKGQKGNSQHHRLPSQESCGKCQ